MDISFRLNEVQKHEPVEEAPCVQGHSNPCNQSIRRSRRTQGRCGLSLAKLCSFAKLSKEVLQY